MKHTGRVFHRNTTIRTLFYASFIIFPFFMRLWPNYDMQGMTYQRWYTLYLNRCRATWDDFWYSFWPMYWEKLYDMVHTVHTGTVVACLEFRFLPTLVRLYYFLFFPILCILCFLSTEKLQIVPYFLRLSIKNLFA